MGQACGRAAGVAASGRTTASDYVERIDAAGLTWPSAQELSETELHALLFKKAEQGRCASFLGLLIGVVASMR